MYVKIHLCVVCDWTAAVGCDCNSSMIHSMCDCMQTGGAVEASGGGAGASRDES